MFVGTAAFFLNFTLKYVPETKGLTVAQVTDEFNEVALPTHSNCGCCPAIPASLKQSERSYASEDNMTIETKESASSP